MTTVVDYKPDAERLLQKLKEMGLTLGIVTTTKRTNMEIYRHANQNIQRKAPLDEYFSFIYTREDAREMKPNPEIYHRVLREQQITSEDCLIFEDSLVGVEAANRAGIAVVAMYDRYSDHERDAINARADYRFDRYADVLAVIEAEQVVC